MATLKKPVAQVHIAKAQLGMDDETYRSFLKKHTGKESCKDLTAKELNSLLEKFKEAGFKAFPGKTGKGKGRKYSNATSRKIVSLWIQLKEAGKVKNGSDRHLRQWCKVATIRDDLPTLDWLTPEEATQCIEALKQWLAR